VKSINNLSSRDGTLRFQASSLELVNFKYRCAIVGKKKRVKRNQYADLGRKKKEREKEERTFKREIPFRRVEPERGAPKQQHTEGFFRLRSCPPSRASERANERTSERANERAARCIPVKSHASQRWLSRALVGEVIVLTGVYRSSTLCVYGGISHWRVVGGG